jgi:hypothetical protein
MSDHDWNMTAGLLSVIFAAQRLAGIDPRVIGLVSKGTSAIDARGRPTNDMQYDHRRGMRTESFVIFEPSSYLETLNGIPEDDYLEVCLAGAPGVPQEPSETDHGCVLLSQFKIDAAPRGLPLVGLRKTLHANGVASWRDGDIIWAAAALDRALPSHTYRIAYNAFRTVISEMAHGLLIKHDPAGVVRLYGYDDEEEPIWVRLDEWSWDLEDGLRSFPGLKPISLEHVLAMERRWSKSGKSIPIFVRLGRRSDLITGNERVSWLVEGVLPRGTVTLLAGARESGKSTLATELAVSSARTGDDEWLDRPISKPDDGLVVLLTGEDTDEIVNERRALLDPDDEVANLVVYALDGRPLADLCKEIARVPNLTLLVVDPARRYLQGDEDGSDAVNQFFGQLDELTRQKKCATLVVHHLKKDAQPKSLAQVGQAIRGSGVFLDRPRVVLGMYRQDDVTHIGVIKNNIPNHPMLSEAALRRDDSTLRHVVIEADELAATHVEVGNDVQARVYEAVAKSIAKGHTLARTGARELWQLRLGELADISRDRIRTAVDALIERGKLLVQGSNLVLAS